MKRLGTSVALAIATLLFGASCGSPPPPPEGFTIQVRFVSIDIEILESLEISIRPTGTTYFPASPDGSYEGGAITTHVEADGSLTMSITGDHVRENAYLSSDGAEEQLDVQIWSEEAARLDSAAAPQIFGFAYRSGVIIGDDSRWLPTWPPPIMEDGVCTPAGFACQMQLAITCNSARPEQCVP